ncbi:MAG: GNAT family N-acetyltransferase [Candidatus Thorarchaeota archaeon]
MSPIQISPAQDLDVYLSIWEQGVRNLYWAQEDYLMDLNLSEERAEISANWAKEGHEFLLAEDEARNPVGVIGYRWSNDGGRIRNWEPVATSSTNRGEVRNVLLESSLNNIQEYSCSYCIYRIKHPYDDPEPAKPFLKLYENAGFSRAQPDAISLLLDFGEQQFKQNPEIDLEIRYWDEFSEQKLVDFSLLAYATTENDVRIHSYDKAVTNPKVIPKVHEHLRNGVIGPTSPKLWKVGLVDGEPAGFIGSFILERAESRRVSVLGPLGVFPEYRRKGVATRLIQLQLRDLQDMGCHYAYVGTPHNNTNAIALYQKTGFQIVDRQILLRKNFE